MGCTAQLTGAETESDLPTAEGRVVRAVGRLTRDRQEAAFCLQAAAVAEDPAERRWLRRCAAELIAPRPRSRRGAF